MANIIPCRSILSKLVKPNCISSLSMSSMPKAPSGPLVAVAQLTATSNHDKNFMDVSICAHQAAEQGCSFLALPECFSFIGSSVQETLDQAEPLEGPRIKQFQQLAKECNIWLSCGGFHEKCPNEEKVFNTHLVIDPNGDIASIYRKIHLFDVDIPNGPVLMESRSTNSGRELITLDTSYVPSSELQVVLGLSTCYDMRFPEMYTLLREEGAQVILAPSAFTVPTGRAHWEVLLRARAIETQSFVIAAAQVGHHNEKRMSWGQAIIIDPWGKVLASAPTYDDLASANSDAADGTEASLLRSPFIVTARLDMNQLHEIRTKMPVSVHRRRDVFDLGVRAHNA